MYEHAPQTTLHVHTDVIISGPSYVSHALTRKVGSWSSTHTTE